MVRHKIHQSEGRDLHMGRLAQRDTPTRNGLAAENEVHRSLSWAGVSNEMGGTRACLGCRWALCRRLWGLVLCDLLPRTLRKRTCMWLATLFTRVAPNCTMPNI